MDYRRRSSRIAVLLACALCALAAWAADYPALGELLQSAPRTMP